MSYAGSCLCGAMCCYVDGEFKSTRHCHGTICQKQHGAACGSDGNLSGRHLEWRQRQEMLHLCESRVSW